MSINLSDSMFEIDVKNNINCVKELLDLHSKYLDPEVVDILKMLRDTKQDRQKLFRDEYDNLSFDARFFQQIATNLKCILDQSFLYRNNKNIQYIKYLKNNILHYI